MWCTAHIDSQVLAQTDVCGQQNKLSVDALHCIIEDVPFCIFHIPYRILHIHRRPVFSRQDDEAVGLLRESGIRDVLNPPPDAFRQKSTKSPRNATTPRTKNKGKGTKEKEVVLDHEGLKAFVESNVAVSMVLIFPFLCPLTFIHSDSRQCRCGLRCDIALRDSAPNRYCV